MYRPPVSLYKHSFLIALISYQLCEVGSLFNSTAANEWTSESTGNVMLSSDMFMAFDVSDPDRCGEDPMDTCNRTNTFQLVRAQYHTFDQNTQC